MNPSMSCLNPHAASYIPLNKREKKDEQKTDLLLHYVSEGTTGTEQDSFQGNADSDSGYELESDLEELLDQAQAEGSDMYLDCLDQEQHAEKYLEYLEIWFPNISKQCIADVFSANHGDLEASVHMPRELESAWTLPMHPNLKLFPVEKKKLENERGHHGCILLTVCDAMLYDDEVGSSESDR